MRLLRVFLLVLPACRPAPPPGEPRCPEGMVAMPAGSFRMGSLSGEPGAHGEEFPAHTVMLSAYCLDVREVSQSDVASRDPGRAVDCADCPAVAATWSEAQAWCEGRGARLPSEAEFERAARAGRDTIYPWGDRWPPPGALVNGRDASLARIEPGWVPAQERSHDDGSPGLAPACAHGRNALGFCDLLGNASEWCGDVWSPSEYSLAPFRDPRGPREGRARVVRGGSFVDGPRDLRPAARTGLDAAGRSALVGWRCASDPAIVPGEPR